MGINEFIQIGNRIKKLRMKKGFTQKEMAEITGIPYSTYSNYENNNREPNSEQLKKIADALNVALIDLIPNSSKQGVSINVLGRVAAGIPIEAIEDIIDTEEITEEMAKTGKFFGLQIHGDSMEPRIYEGDVVIVRQQDDAESGDVVIALINGDDATCKRLRKYRDGIELVAMNPSYQPIFFSNEDIAKKPVKIIGKVVELRGKF